MPVLADHDDRHGAVFHVGDQFLVGLDLCNGRVNEVLLELLTARVLGDQLVRKRQRPRRLLCQKKFQCAVRFAQTPAGIDLRGYLERDVARADRERRGHIKHARPRTCAGAGSSSAGTSVRPAISGSIRSASRGIRVLLDLQEQSSKTRTLRRAQCLQALLYDRSVLTGQAHDIGDRADRDNIKVILPLFFSDLIRESRAQRVNEL